MLALFQVCISYAVAAASILCLLIMKFHCISQGCNAMVSFVHLLLLRKRDNTFRKVNA